MLLRRCRRRVDGAPAGSGNIPTAVVEEVGAPPPQWRRHDSLAVSSNLAQVIGSARRECLKLLIRPAEMECRIVSRAVRTQDHPRSDRDYLRSGKARFRPALP